MTKTGFRLTAAALEDSLKKINPSDISAFVFCDPNNPAGTTPGKEEWGRIALVLNRYPGVPIILDEAYAEMCFDGCHDSLFKVAPQLAPRIVLLRSATKGLSAAGERLAVAVVPDAKMRNGMLDFITNISLNTPKSHQNTYAIAMQKLTEEKRKALASFYGTRVRYMQDKLNVLGISIQDPTYRPNATFYLLADLSRLKGKVMNAEAAKICNKVGKYIETDIDIAYHLLFETRLAVAPLSYFGLDPNKCLFRVTCSDGIDVLDEISSRLKLALAAKEG